MRTLRPATAKPSSAGRPAVMQRKGLRRVSIWIPDMDEETFRREAHRQALAVANGPGAKEDQEFVDAISMPFPEE